MGKGPSRENRTTPPEQGFCGLVADVETLWLDRGYDSNVTRERLAEHKIDDAIIAKKRKRGAKEPKENQRMGLRWPVERTNSWLSNYGQLRRNTDRTTSHRLAQPLVIRLVTYPLRLLSAQKLWAILDPETRPSVVAIRETLRIHPATVNAGRGLLCVGLSMNEFLEWRYDSRRVGEGCEDYLQILILLRQLGRFDPV